MKLEDEAKMIRARIRKLKQEIEQYEYEAQSAEHSIYLCEDILEGSKERLKVIKAKIKNRGK